MAKITILIEGIALSYQKDNRWKILFPFDDCHNIKFSYSSGSEDQDFGPLAKANRRIEIRTTGPVISTHSVGTYYNDFIDFTANYSHKDGLEMLPDWNQYGILLTIQNALFRLFEFTNTKSVLREVSGIVDPIVFGPEIVGYSAMAHIETGEGGSVELVQIDDGVETPIKSFSSDARLIFDNNCDEINPNSDTEMLYQLVKGKDTDTQRFSSVRDPDDPHIAQPQFSPIQPQSQSILGIDNTENPPVASDDDSVPCHKFRASKPDGLV